ncbi:lachesin-like isoform X2 [Haemaphysalis longicornis]
MAIKVVDTAAIRYSLGVLLVLVAGMTSATTAKPRFLSGIKNVTVAQGREATLECHIENLGKNKVAWIKMDTETLLTYHRHIIVGEPRLRVSDNNERHWQLHIRNAQPSDKGFYMCQINTEPMITEVGFLDVLVPPSILDEETSSDATVDEGSRVSLHCRATGYPPATILWRREDGREINLERYSGRKNSVMSVEGEFLNISQVNREDMGAYLCIAKNGVPPSVSQRILLQVNFRPKIRVSEQLVGAAVGTSVFLECVVEASPRPLTAWIRSDDQILLRSKKYAISEEVESYRIRMRLQIHDLRQSDYGRYKCHAKNTFGEKEGFIRLHDGLPSNEQSRTGHSPLDRVHFEPPERNRGGSSSDSSRNVPCFHCCSAQQLLWSTALLYVYRWSL